MIKFKISLLGILIILLTLFGVGCSERGTSGVTGPGMLPVVVLPAGSTLVSATFNAYIYRVDDLNSEPVDLHRVLAPWDELTVTWNSFHPGGTLNYDPAISATLDGVTANTEQIWVELDVTGMIQSWMAGTYPNLGMLMRKNNISPRTVFYSREADAQPFIEMEFATPDGPVFVTEVPLADAMIGAHLPDLSPDEKAIVERVELLRLRELVRGPYQARQRGRLAPAAVVERPLI